MKKSKEQRYIESLIAKEPKLEKFLNENNLYLNELNFGNIRDRVNKILTNPDVQGVIKNLNDYSIMKGITPADLEAVSNLLNSGNISGAIAYFPAWAVGMRALAKYGPQVQAEILRRFIAAKEKAAHSAEIKKLNLKNKHPYTYKALSATGKVAGSVLGTTGRVVGAAGRAVGNTGKVTGRVIGAAGRAVGNAGKAAVKAVKDIQSATSNAMFPQKLRSY